MTSPKRDERSDGQSDVELLHGIAGGQQAMLGTLYDRYAAATFGLLLRIVGSRSRGEELLQDVFLQVWRRAGDYETQRGSVAAWLFTIARNRALDVVRSAEHRRLDLLEETPVVADESAIAPDREASREERARDVRAAIEQLTPPQRQAVELAYYEGLSHSEIATRLAQPLGTVKSRIGQAMVRLREALRTHEDQPG